MGYYKLAQIEFCSGKIANSIKNYASAIRLAPDFADAYGDKGVALARIGQFDEAISCYDEAIGLDQNYAEAFYNKGLALVELGKSADALTAFRAAVMRKPFPAARLSLAAALRENNRLEEALAELDRLVNDCDDYADAFYNRGNVLRDLKRLEEAVANYARAIALNPDHAESHDNRGRVLAKMGKLEEALADHDTAIALKPNFAQAYVNRAIALGGLNRPQEALAAYDRAIALKPDFAEAHTERGLLLADMMRLDEALASFEKALALDPDIDFLPGVSFYLRRQICDWRDDDARAQRLVDLVEAGRRAAMPFSQFGVTNSSSILQKTSKIWWDANTTTSAHAYAPPSIRAGGKLRIGYFSADFRNHPMMHLLSGVFARHDKTQFEIYAFSFGRGAEDDITQRVKPAFDRFIDARQMSDKELIEAARKVSLDIAVDACGYTTGSRPNIFRQRVAPIQVNYLGFAGTMASGCMDYIVCDPIVISAEARPTYDERLAVLPHSYLANDDKRAISERTFSRAELGLPGSGFVFSCFNNSFKFTPDVFASWMRILSGVEGSVLWLVQSTPSMMENLRNEAQRRGIDPSRLVFAPRMPVDEHLARHRQADLFLDTLPFNAHTTASDALWAGLPVLTRIGEAFPGRVAASLLTAIGLPELVTRSSEDYEARAIQLALEPATLAGIKSKLAANRLTTPLFDTSL